MTEANVEVMSRDSVVDIVITGEIDMSNSDVVQVDVFSAVGNHLVAVRIDLTGVRYIDSAGLRVLFSLAERLRLLQTSCTVVAPEGSPARRVLEIAGFDTVAELRG